MGTSCLNANYQIRTASSYHINMQTFYLQNTPLHIALMSEQANTIKTVLQLGGDPLIKNSAGENAFDLASKLRLSDYIVKLLKKSVIQQSILFDLR